MKDFDIVIIGGGCAGLSLAYELETNNKLKNKTLAIIEPRNEYKKDKTWSFWKTFPHNFESIKETLATADLFYDSSFSSIKDIPLSLRFSILVARRVYRQIGRNIIKKQTIQNYNQSGKIFVTNIAKILQTLLSIFDLLKLSLIKKHNHLRDKEHELISEEINLDERF